MRKTEREVETGREKKDIDSEKGRATGEKNIETQGERKERQADRQKKRKRLKEKETEIGKGDWGVSER